MRALLAATLVGIYVMYVVMTFRASSQLVDAGHGTEAPHTMFLSRLGVPTNLATIALQLLLGVALLVGGAKGFIHGVEGVSHALGISALLLSLIIVPIATELPEKVNSVLWIRRRKDTLAFGNITGAMVFQGTLLPAIGIMLTPWEPRPEVLTGVIITLAAAAWLRVNARTRGLAIWALLANGAGMRVSVPDAGALKWLNGRASRSAARRERSLVAPAARKRFRCASDSHAATVARRFPCARCSGPSGTHRRRASAA